MQGLITYTGKVFDFFNPTADMICIEDIAYALACIPRFGGHTRYHSFSGPQIYSVAEHLLLCAKAAPPECKLLAIVHDMHEAYTGDIPYPLKLWLRSVTSWDFIKYLEGNIDKAIAVALGLPPWTAEQRAIVKTIDYGMRAIEAQRYMQGGTNLWADQPTDAQLSSVATVSARDFHALEHKLREEKGRMFIDSFKMYAREAGLPCANS